MSSITAAWAVGQGLDGREAAQTAAQKALSALGATRPAFGLAFVSEEYVIADALGSLTDVLGSTPVWGFGTSCPLTAGGEHPRSVVVGLIAGSEVKARPFWAADYVQDSDAAAAALAQALQTAPPVVAALLACDGVRGDPTPLTGALDAVGLAAGCQPDGDIRLGKTFQFAGTSGAFGGLGALLLSGKIKLGVGLGHGWTDVGVHLPVTQTRGSWIQGLDGVSPAEAYGRAFGYPARQWGFPPLKDLARLYPLGIAHGEQMLLRAPVHVEVDGSFRMSIPVAEGDVARLMVGNPAGCLTAARAAVKDARKGLGKSKPVLGLVLVDRAWRQLFELTPGQIMETLSAELDGVPLIGAYTLAQIARHSAKTAPVLQNQHLMVALFGAGSGE
ncbi:MAG TPA: FIST N-terminal domain-containing protein [Anaerolineaceae bacterium]|nr:FIST N-terminal domain-containing protein [Anaerolineaceae bacterium]HOG78842.1 FIST N-terminal domain-containing protein [Anaerolineaceae bacterium]